MMSSREMPTPISMDQTIAGRRYATDVSTLVAWGDFGDRLTGRDHRVVFLFLTAEGRYFAQRQTQEGDEVCSQGCSLQPLSLDEAVRLYADLVEKILAVEDAFPPE